MSNLPILYFTLGALAGLPAGYGLGWCCDPAHPMRAVVEFVCGMRAMDKEVERFTQAFLVMQGAKV